MQHELAKRTADGIVVRLVWDALQDRVIVRYRDRRTGDAFIADVPKDQALVAFRHPNAFRSSLASAA
jgi:hypothetical protein